MTNIVCMYVKHNHYSSASNGYIDSLRTLLSDFNNENRIIVCTMLKSFQSLHVVLYNFI